VLLATPYHRGAIGRAKAAFNLNRRRGLVNQEMDSGGERLPQVQQIAHDSHQHDLLVELRFAHGAKEVPQILDLAPIDNNHVKFVLLDQRQRRFAVPYNLRRHMQLVQDISRDPRELDVRAKQQSMHLERRLPGVFHLRLLCCY